MSGADIARAPRRAARHPKDGGRKADEWAWAHDLQNRELGAIQSLLDEFLDGRGSARALDAGCGSRRKVDIRSEVHTVGIDVSQRQLERNQHLAERILGDLQTYPLPERSFDLVICWDVLEHLAKPEAALCNMRRALKPDGLMILALPNLMSVKGLITKFSPLAFHAWFYRRVFGSNTGDEDDVGPFPTVFRLAMSPKRIRRFSEESGLRVVHFGYFESPMQRLVRARYRVTGRVWKAIRFAVKWISMGRIDPERTELIVVLGGPELRSDTRPARPQARVSTRLGPGRAGRRARSQAPR